MGEAPVCAMFQRLMVMTIKQIPCLCKYTSCARLCQRLGGPFRHSLIDKTHRLAGNLASLFLTRIRPPTTPSEILRRLGDGDAVDNQSFRRDPVDRSIDTMPRDPLIALVGKPSSGKSTTLNRWGGSQCSNEFGLTTSAV